MDEGSLAEDLLKEKADRGRSGMWRIEKKKEKKGREERKEWELDLCLLRSRNLVT